MYGMYKAGHKVGLDLGALVVQIPRGEAGIACTCDSAMSCIVKCLLAVIGSGDGTGELVLKVA